MAEFLIGDVKQVRELFDSNKVNKHLNDGWVLLSNATGTDESGYPICRYALGWLGEASPKEEYQY